MNEEQNQQLQRLLDTIEAKFLSVGGTVQLGKMLGMGIREMDECSTNLGEGLNATLHVKKLLGLQSNLSVVEETGRTQ